MSYKRMLNLPIAFLFFLLFLGVLIVIPFIISGAFRMLGFSPWQTFALFFFSLMGSVVNIPIYSFKSRQKVQVSQPGFLSDLLYPPRTEYREVKSTIAVNLGGAIIPLLITVYLVIRFPYLVWQFIVGTAVISVICYRLARPIQGVGISMPLIIPPLSAALVSFILPGSPQQAIAYVAGVGGVLIGADLMNLRETMKLGGRTLSIGGAGTFDGIFLTGIVAVLLTA